MKKAPTTLAARLEQRDFIDNARRANPTKQYQAPIPTEEYEAASKYFAIHNLAMEHLLKENGSIQDLNRAWSRVVDDIESETGHSPEPERLDWLKIIKKDGKKASSYVSKEWLKFIQKQSVIDHIVSQPTQEAKTAAFFSTIKSILK